MAYDKASKGKYLAVDIGNQEYSSGDVLNTCILGQFFMHLLKHKGPSSVVYTYKAT